MLKKRFWTLTPRADTSRASCATAAISTVFLHVTKACNLNCSYCYFSARTPLPDEMNRVEYAALWPELIALGPKSVVFTGGEPLLRDDIVDLLVDLQSTDRDHTIRRCLNTNGHFVNGDVAKQLVGIVDEVRVSLDALETRNDGVRGAGNFANGLAALRHFRDVGFEPKVLVTVTSVSLPDLEALIVFLIEEGFTRITLNGVRLVGRAQQHPELAVDHKAIEDVVASAWTRFMPQTHFAPPGVDRSGSCHCGVGHFLNILPNGDVFPCHVLVRREFRCGNVRDEPLSTICQPGGILSDLAALDFRDLAQRETRLSSLVDASTCLGNVYAKTKDLPEWRRVLPLRPSGPRQT